MTNREWLSTLSDEDFAKWCFYPVSQDANGNYIQPFPTLQTIAVSNTSSYGGLLGWLKEERIEYDK